MREKKIFSFSTLNVNSSCFVTDDGVMCLTLNTIYIYMQSFFFFHLAIMQVDVNFMSSFQDSFGKSKSMASSGHDAEIISRLFQNYD